MNPQTPCITGIGLTTSLPDNPASLVYHRKALKIMDRRSLLLLPAAHEALRMASLDCREADGKRGVSLAVGIGSLDENHLRQTLEPYTSTPVESVFARLNQQLNPLWLLGCLPNMPASHLAIQFRCQGPSYTCGNLAQHGREALLNACHAIADGRADVMLAGAVEALASTTTRAIRQQESPAGKVGEGAVLFVLESTEHAQARNAPISLSFSLTDLDRFEHESRNGMDYRTADIPMRLANHYLKHVPGTEA